jgi:hypothetical protein
MYTYTKFSLYSLLLLSNIIKGKIQHDKTFAAAAAIATAISLKKIQI